MSLNTLGQDREFTDGEIKFVLDTLKHFKESWESVEKKNLEADVKWKIDSTEYDHNYTDFFQAQDATEIEKVV